MTTPPPTTTTSGQPSEKELADIQGNIIGFKNDHQRLLFVSFADTATAKAFTVDITSQISTGQEVRDANARYSARAARGEDPQTEQDCWVNIAFTADGLQMLQAPGLENFPDDFRQGMATRAAIIGDVDNSAPATWLSPFAPNQPAVHAMITLAADAPTQLETRTANVRALIATHSVTELGFQDGNIRPAPNTGHEHFGFKDGISQPGVAGLTKSSKGGEPIAAGEFLIGYPDQDGHVSGSATPPGPPPQPGEPGYPGPGAPPGPALPDWARNGSFAVYRRLRQDVAGFADFLAQHAADVGLNADQLGAKLVGRWPSGAPLEHVPGEPHTIDPATSDPSAIDKAVVDDNHINNFTYADDSDGATVPRGAHTRKAWPRDSAPGGETETNRHRMLRRGMPYGPEFVPGEPAYGQTVPVNQDRGLIFVCYQSSIARSFEFVQASWANAADFPAPSTGQDPIISQNSDQPGLAIPPNPHLATARWGTTTGGGYFLAPSISGLRELCRS